MARNTRTTKRTVKVAKPVETAQTSNKEVDLFGTVLGMIETQKGLLLNQIHPDEHIPVIHVHGEKPTLLALNGGVSAKTAMARINNYKIAVLAAVVVMRDNEGSPHDHLFVYGKNNKMEVTYVLVPFKKNTRELDTMNMFIPDGLGGSGFDRYCF